MSLVSVLFFSVRPKNIQSTSKSSFAKRADVGWLPKWKLQDINFMILGIEKTVYNFERQRNEYHSSSCLGKSNDDKASDTAARKKLL
jgi:hypothetical protein